MRAVLAILGLGGAACLTQPEFRGRPGLDDGGAGDGGSDGVTIDSRTDVGCVPSTPMDTFSANGMTCGPWAVKLGMGEGYTLSGYLRVAASPGVSVTCESTSMVPFTAGVFVELNAVSGGMPADTAYLEVRAAPANVRLAYAIDTAFLPVLQLEGGGTPSGVPFVLADMRWWRLRPQGTDRIEASYSSNGREWTTLGFQPAVNASGNHVIAIGAQGAAGFASAEVESLNTCPSP